MGKRIPLELKNKIVAHAAVHREYLSSELNVFLYLPWEVTYTYVGDMVNETELKRKEDGHFIVKLIGRAKSACCAARHYIEVRLESTVRTQLLLI